MSVITSAPVNPAHPWIAAEHASFSEVTALIADPVLLRPAGWRWWIALGVSGLFVLAIIVAIYVLFTEGIGVWGVNSTVVWGYAIASYVWWIAIGSGGTLISAMLLITRQRWRASVNRFAETMTIFAVAISGLFPILHLGRPQYFYWLAPYPNTMLLWPQWRSPLVWDFWAIVRLVVIGLDPKDSAEDARVMARQIGDPAVERVTILLRGDAGNVHQLTDALGYRYRHDTAADQFAHPAGALVMTADGLVSRTLSSLALNPRDLRLALVEASEGHIGTFADRLTLLCYGFDAAHGVYAPAIARMLQLLAAFTVIGLFGLIAILERNRRMTRDIR